MDNELPFEELLELAGGKIKLGDELIKHLDAHKGIEGVSRIQKKINQEIKFLQKVIKNKTLKRNHIQCSNLTHYSFLVQILLHQNDVVHVDCAIPAVGRTDPLRVDIVCENGTKWVKAIARNPTSLTDAANGTARYGSRSILDQAEEFVEASAHNLCMFKPPKNIFYFSHGIDETLRAELEKIGVEVASVSEFAHINNSPNTENVFTLNIDITTLLAYVSNLCNGSSNYIFCEKILSEQAENERKSPLRPILDPLFAGKRLICCETAHKSYQQILSLLAGPQETNRSMQLMKRIEVLPDVSDIPDELATIKLSGKINERSLKIFAFGMHMKAMTVTSNKAFVRAAKMQGINVPVFTHQARALTEGKEATAQLIK